MNSSTFRAAPVEGGIDHLPHLSGPASEIRQVLAAHFVRDCPHILEIGGYIRPVTNYLTHRPISVISVDPKTPPFEADELNGHPCKVRHVDKKFQQVEYAYAPHSYDAAFMLALAIETAGSTDHVKVRDALRRVGSIGGVVIQPGEWKKAKEAIAKKQKITYHGAAGNHVFDKNGDVSGVVDVLRLKIQS